MYAWIITSNNINITYSTMVRRLNYNLPDNVYTIPSCKEDLWINSGVILQMDKSGFFYVCQEMSQGKRGLINRR